MIILDRQKIEQVLNWKFHLPELMALFADAFIQFSKGQSVNAIPIHLNFAENHGECHIKAGYNHTDDLFLVKISTGFYLNQRQGLPSGDGMMILGCKNTGQIKAVLCDEGYLTLMRTAITACLVVRLTPWDIDAISIIGTGGLAQLIIELMHQLYPNTVIRIWGRDQEKVRQIQLKFSWIESATDLNQLVRQGGVVFTTTASQHAFILPEAIERKIHCIALGADQPNKQEIASAVFAMADCVVVDSLVQANKLGDTAVAMDAGAIQASDVIELGHALEAGSPAREARVLITDLTGVAPQDLVIAKFIYTHSV